MAVRDARLDPVHPLHARLGPRRLVERAPVVLVESLPVLGKQRRPDHRRRRAPRRRSAGGNIMRGGSGHPATVAAPTDTGHRSLQAPVGGSTPRSTAIAAQEVERGRRRGRPAHRAAAALGASAVDQLARREAPHPPPAELPGADQLLVPHQVLANRRPDPVVAPAPRSDVITHHRPPSSSPPTAPWRPRPANTSRIPDGVPGPATHLLGRGRCSSPHRLAPPTGWSPPRRRPPR